MPNNKTNTRQFDARLAKVYAGMGDKEKHYDEWARTYEDDLVNDMEYVAHKDAGDIFIDVVEDKTLKVLDVACGTGLVGEYLKNKGYMNIDGVDFSNEMLVVSEERAVYQALWQHDFTQPAKVKKLYDALICVGLFSFDIPRISDLHNVVNCVSPGGYCIVTVNGAAWTQLDLEKEVMAESIKHAFSVEQTLHAGYIQKEGIDSRVLVIKR